MHGAIRWRKARSWQGGTSSMSAEEKNKALVRRFLEARAKADLTAIEELLAPDFVDHTLAPAQQPDREGYRRQIAEYVSPFSDRRFVFEDQIAAGDKVVDRKSVV